MSDRIMVIDDEESIRFSLKEALEDAGYEVETVAYLSEAKARIVEFMPQVILLDMRLKDGNGLEFMDTIRALDDEIKIIVITAYGDVETAVQAMKLGASEYVVKPFDLEEIEVLVERAIDHYRLNRRVKIFEDAKEKGQLDISTGDDGMKQLLDEAFRIARQKDITVLVTGETGTGKELMADFIHMNSPLQDMPMVKLNCATIPKDLFESELFGHEKHAFTGAGQRKKGLFEIADGGTIFLDEVGEIPLTEQAKLLRVLEDRKIKRVGGTQEIPIDVRIIAATNRDLLRMVNEGVFRADFYYRLNVVPIMLMPLRQRPGDIQLLAKKFLEEFNVKFKKSFKGFSDEAQGLMATYAWPGNVRELKNLIERACIVNDGEWIHAIDFPIYQHPTSTSSTLTDVLSDLERGQEIDLVEILSEIENECIDVALKVANGNQSRAAELLNISRFALKRRLDKE
ncbi:MAG: sigma-54-dependent Fis family transcriptional regulator [Clostridia bacterium]|nr:sigma-54-dependent Fis family transcriptional regulator [Clostridia bacterium]